MSCCCSFDPQLANLVSPSPYGIQLELLSAWDANCTLDSATSKSYMPVWTLLIPTSFSITALGTFGF